MSLRFAAVMVALLSLCGVAPRAAQAQGPRVPPPNYPTAGAPQYAPPGGQPAPGQPGPQPGGQPGGQPGAQPVYVPPTGAAPAGMAPAAPAPFVLTAQEQADLDQLLAKWEERSAKITAMHCNFTLWEYNEAFKKHTEKAGKLRYRAPDHGVYHVQFEKTTGPNGEPQWEPSAGEHWSCDGNAVFEFRETDKTLIEHRLPEELKGSGIQQSPLPFLFVAKAADLKKRYFLRITTTPEDHAKGQVWLEAHPRYQADAANFRRAELILTAKDFLPYGMKLYQPDGGNTTHVFTDYKVNPLRVFDWGEFTPATPTGWQRKVEEPLAPASAARPAAAKPKLWLPFQQKKS